MNAVSRRIDHVVVAVRDLDVAAAFYESLGFQVGARNRHPWGTENRLIQFSSSFIELIAIAPDATIPEHGPGRFSFGAFVRDYLRRQEGLAMLALDSGDAAGDAALFAEADLGSFEPFFFERKGRRPDETEVRVAFTLAFAVAPDTPDAGFFVCQQHSPENFWRTAFQRHDNGAIQIIEVAGAAAEPVANQAFLSAFSGFPAFRDTEDRLSIDLRGGRLEVVRNATVPGNLRLTSFTVAVSDMSALADCLFKSGVPFVQAGAGIWVSPKDAFGLTIGFKVPPSVRTRTNDCAGPALPAPSL